MEVRGGIPQMLEGWTVATRGRAGLPGLVCAEHLALLGARWLPDRPGQLGDSGAELAGALTLEPPATAGPEHFASRIACEIGWYGPGQPAPHGLGSEALVQAVSGLMGVHGRDQGRPRRLGLEVASVAAGISAAQAVLAALIANNHGHRLRRVETSVLQAALLFLYHHLTIATSGNPFPSPPPDAPPGPPFRTADGHDVELEVLSFDSWIGFWRQLGVERAGLEAAWSNFVYRYLAGSCSLPEALHAAAGRCTLAELHRVAGSCGVAVCRVRGYPELIIDQGWTERATRSGVRCEPHLGTPWTLQAGSGKHERNGIHHSPSDLPLAGLRVVEITSRLQGPLAGLLLRMLGADVLKVEPPGGDFGRHSPPLAGSRGAAYLAYNRDKRVVEIDYKQPEGRAQLVDLIAGADVVLHNWPLRRAEKLGLDFEDLERVNPGLVYAHASGWGRVGNEPSPIAGDSLVQAHAACGDGLSPADEPALPSRVTILDALGGLLACEGILAGLYLRDCTGHGSRVDTSLFAGAMTLQAHILRSMPPNGETGRRLGRPLWGPLDRPLETGDGFLTLDLSDPRARPCVARLCGCHPDAPDELIAQRLLRRTAAEWETLICASGVPAAAVQTDLASLPADPRVGGLLERVEDACWAPAAPWRLSL